MAKTIIQTIGPLYGEVVNGTVFGQPNGSIYTPSTNTLKLAVADAFKYLINYAPWDGAIVPANAGGVKAGLYTYVAEAQDIQSWVTIQVATDSDFDTVVSEYSANAGMMTGTFGNLGKGYSILDETTYYVRAILVNNGVAVATSDVITVTGVANE